MTAEDGFEVLLVTPTGRDAVLIEGVLESSRIQSRALRDVQAAIAEFRAKDVGALLIAEEALSQEIVAVLAAALKEQPAWSFLPILVFTMRGRETVESQNEERRWLSLGNTTLLERPIRMATLLTSVQTALHARRRQYERRFAEGVLRQSEKLAAVGRLASSIAHEINNPLEAVTNLLYLLDHTPLNAEQRRYLDSAQQELARVAEIASQTLTFNRQRDIRGKASIAALLDSVLVLYQGRLSGSKTVIDRRYQNTAPFICYPGELRQVFANLIGNAFDATRKGGRIILRERAARHPKTGVPGVRISVGDSGTGMSAEIRAHLFELFKSTKGNNGSGLGLWISKGIIEKHRGSIQVRSCDGLGRSGTVFSIFIPMSDEHGRPVLRLMGDDATVR